MKERVNRQGDENLYQPKIHSERIRELYRLKLLTGLPMTVLVDQAICEFLESYGVRTPREDLANEIGERTD